MANQKVIYLWCFLIQFGLINTNWAVTSDTLNHKNQPFKRFAIGYTYSLLNPDFNSYIPLGLTLDFHVNRKWSCSAGAYANYFTRSKSPTMVVAGYQVIDTIEFGYGWPSATLSDRKEYLKYLVFASLSRSLLDYQYFSIHLGLGIFYSSSEQNFDRKIYVTNGSPLDSNLWPSFGYSSIDNSKAYLGGNGFLESSYFITPSLKLALTASLIFREEERKENISWKWYLVWEDQQILRRPEYKTSQTSSNQDFKFLFFSNCSLKFYF